MAQTFMFADDGVVPNNPTLPVVVMAASMPTNAAEVNAIYRQNGWEGAWEYTVYDYIHYHPDAHEVVTCIKGWGNIQLGGPKGREFRLTPGDCIVLPAGTGHCLKASDATFCAVGAYPPGQKAAEVRHATAENYFGSRRCIVRVPLPTSCPVTGRAGTTIQAWTIS